VEAIHMALAYVATATVVVGIGGSLASMRVASVRMAWFGRFQLLVVALLATTAIAGLTEFASGAEPREGLHFLYAAIAIGVIPLARSFVPAADRRANVAAAAAFVVLAFVIYRLFATG
jgi:hypothetical protein